MLAVGIALLILHPRAFSLRIGISFTLIGAALSAFMVFFHLTYPTPEAIEIKHRLLFSTDPASVNQLVVEPSKTDNQSRLNLVTSAINISNRGDVAKLMNALQGAQRFSPNHPGAQWSCLLTVSAGEETVTIEVSETKDKKNGCLIYVWSNRTDGWLLENYRCDELGPILEDLTRSKRN